MSAKYATLTKEGLKVEDPVLLEKFRDKMLSASLITGILQCPAQYASNSILPIFLEKNLDNAMTWGSMFHRVMELLFAQEKDSRGIEVAKELVADVLAEEDFTHFTVNTEALMWLDNAIDNYFAMGAKPESVSIADYKGKGGIEIRVMGNIEGCERQFHGFIDRLSYGKDGGFVIDDWKTGANTKRYNPKDKYEKGWPEARQQILYAYIINNESESENDEAKKARLVFPVTKDVVIIDLKNESYQRKAIDDTVRAEKAYNKAVDENSFEYKQSFLCHWCPLVKACPGAMKPVRRVQKAADAYDSQPDIEDLAIGLNF